jgi:hypothetical protein
VVLVRVVLARVFLARGGKSTRPPGEPGGLGAFLGGTGC